MAGKKGKAADAADGGFDYGEAVAELERIVTKVEDPATGIDDIDKYIKKADMLISGCRKYLRMAREKADRIETY